MLGAALAAGCDGPEPAAGASAADAIGALERFTSRLGSGAAVSNTEFQAAMEPFSMATLAGWADEQVRSASSSLDHLRSALVDRYRPVAPYCAEDGLTRYSICGEGYICVAAAQVIEVRCLWFASTAS